MRFLLTLVILSASTATAVSAQNASAGNQIEVRLEHKVTTESAHAGDNVTARVSRAVKHDKDVVVPEGSLVQGRVDFVKSKSTTEDGWMRLLFDRIELPGGRSVNMLASAAFHRNRPRGAVTRLVVVPAFATIGALLGGHTKRVAGGLGGAIIGIVLVENRQRYGHDLTLHTGQLIRLRLSGDLY